MGKETFSICCQRGKEELFKEAAQEANLEVAVEDWGNKVVNLQFQGDIRKLWEAIGTLYLGGLKKFWQDEEERMKRDDRHLL